ncbi:MAG: hypothetical protein H6600_09255 [Flavobacteriales bacterium]|nr:hypothetical protein [Flavobacteriales bacterium]
MIRLMFILPIFCFHSYKILAQEQLEYVCHRTSIKVKNDSIHKIKDFNGSSCYYDPESYLLIEGEFYKKTLAKGYVLTLDAHDNLTKILPVGNSEIDSVSAIKIWNKKNQKFNPLIICGAGEKKNGHWKLTGEMMHNSDYCDTCIIEEGEYIESRKNGVWIRYYPDGSIQSKITYINGKPIGPFETYYSHNAIQTDYLPKTEKVDSLRIFNHQNGDPINQTDVNGKKNNWWIITGYMRNMSDYCPECVIEEGNYQLNRKVGLWYRYYPSGNIKNKIFYKNGKANGPFETYYPDGKLEEKGIWSGKSYTIDTAFKYLNEYFSPDSLGRYTYYSSGCVREIHYNYNSIATRYAYLDDCNNSKYGTLDTSIIVKSTPYISSPPYIVQWKSPTYEDANPKQTKSEIYIYKNDPPIEKKEIPFDSISPNKSIAFHCVDIGEPYAKCYNENKDILLEGEFKEDKLSNGKYYIYDEYGLLERIAVFKEGMYVGDDVVE